MAAKYLNSLVSYILDTKPYHSKLSEVVEEYLFADSMTVSFEERLFSNVTMKAAWPYTFFSGGPSSSAVMPLKRVYHNLETARYPNNQPLNRGAFKAFRDEVVEFPGVEFTFDPRSIQGVGIKDLVLQRNGNTGRVEPMLEGHDFFLSHGAYTFQVLKTRASNVVGTFIQLYEDDDGPFPITVTLPFSAPSLELFGPVQQVSSTEVSVTAAGWVRVFGVQDGPVYAPELRELRDQSLFTELTISTQQHALDVLNPFSSINLIADLLDQIEGTLATFSSGNPGIHVALLAQAAVEIAALRAVLAEGRLPSTYEALLRPLHESAGPHIPEPVGFDTWFAPYGVDGQSDVGLKFTELTPGLFFNSYTDAVTKRSGALRYERLVHPELIISSITADPERATYEEFTLRAETETFVSVHGSATGLIGGFTVGDSFSTPFISFSSAAGTDALQPGTELQLTPAERITIHADAALEQWSLIKVNPLAYSRPFLNSTRYGYIVSQTAQVGRITILDGAFPTGTVEIRLTSANTFTVTSTGDGSYVGSGTVGVPFNDGRLAFTVMNGSEYTFTFGDVFFVEINNPEAEPLELDLLWGYDVEPYSDDTLQYTSALFPAYLETLDFGFNGRFVDYDLDALGLTLEQGVISGGMWRIRALPDLASPITPAGLDASIELFYANRFALELHDGVDWTVLDSNVPIGAPYSNSTYGISFTIQPASKPFIASRVTYSNDGFDGPFTAEGGDVFSFTVLNDGATQTEPAGLTSGRVPRLVIHGDSYHSSTPAVWTLTFSGALTYELQGIYTTGTNAGSSVFGAPVSIDAGAGRSYQDETNGLHWTVISGSSFGLGAGDSFTFETFDRHPTYLVHGSVSGWQPEAQVGQWYWNGKIGFKIQPPTVKFIDPLNPFIEQGESPWSTVYGSFSLNWVRSDSSDHVYVLRSNAPNHWTLYRDGAVVGHGNSTVQDRFISVTVPSAPVGTEFQLWVESDEPALTVGHDLAIIRSTAGRMPTSNDFLVIERTRSDDVGVAIRAVSPTHELALQDLEPLTIDIRFVDLNANSGVPLSSTSPETSVLSGWLPLRLEHLDTELDSPAVFSDSSIKTKLYSASTGELVGTVASTSTNPDSPVFLTWDASFYNKYLPLNAEATVVTYGTGTNEHVLVNITEGIRFLLSGGSQVQSALFNDDLTVGVQEQHDWSIRSSYEQSLGVQIQDGPFGGFLPGYDNTPYDFETGFGDLNGEGGGSYDMGFPLQDWFERAKLLSVQGSLSPVEQDELNTLLSLLGGSLTNGDIQQTTLNDFIQNTSPAISVRVATTAPITLSGSQLIDGVLVAPGELVLVKNQNTSTNNGVYTVNAGAWTRAVPTIELDTFGFIEVLEGATYAGTWWFRAQPLVSFTYYAVYTPTTVGFGLPKLGMAMAIRQTHENTGCEAIDLTRSGYTLVSGNGTLFTNGSSEHGQTMVLGSQNSGTIASIEKTFFEQQLVELKFKVRLDALNPDDGGSIGFLDGSDGILTVTPARESTFDALRRPHVSYRALTTLPYTSNVVYPTALVVDRWYQFEFYRDGANFACRVTDLETNAQAVTPVGQLHSGFNGPLFTSTDAGGLAGFVGGGVGFGGGVFIGFNNGSGGFATSSTFKRSGDGGQTWQTIVTGLPARQNWGIQYAAGAFVVNTGVATADRAIYRSIDGGLTWTYNSTALPSNGFWYAFGSNGSRLMAARWSTNVLAVSDDGGASWSSVTLPATANWYGLVFSNGRWLLSSRTNRIVYASNDNGATWAALSTVPGTGTLGPLSVANGKVFIRTLGTPDANLWVSSDDGASWTTVTLPITGGSGSVSYFTPGPYWYIFRGAGTGQVLISTDATTWQIVVNTVPFTTTGTGSAFGDGVLVFTDFVNNQAARAVLDNFTPLEEPMVNKLTFTIDNNGLTSPVTYSDVVLCSEEEANAAAVGIQEAMTVTAVDNGYGFATDGFDVGSLDVSPDIFAISVSASLPPLPPSGLPTVGTLYADFETPFFISTPARVVDLSFSTTPSSTPTVYYWPPTASAPIQVPVLTAVSSRVFRFSVPSATEMKIIAV